MRQQCDLLQINRSTLYYKAHGADIDDISLLNEIRDAWERYPFYGYRRITTELQFKGFNVNHKRIQRLMKRGGIQAIYPGPNTSRRNQLHAVYPYLLKEVPITRVNQVWMIDITYLRLESGFVYLVALIDVHSRFVLSWKISTTLETTFCIEALKLGLEIGIPEIINSDQGCQFTSDEWIDFLKNHQIKKSV